MTLTKLIRDKLNDIYVEAGELIEKCDGNEKAVLLLAKEVVTDFDELLLKNRDATLKAVGKACTFYTVFKALDKALKECPMKSLLQLVNLFEAFTYTPCIPLEADDDFVPEILEEVIRLYLKAREEIM